MYHTNTAGKQIQYFINQLVILFIIQKISNTLSLSLTKDITHIEIWWTVTQGSNAIVATSSKCKTRLFILAQTIVEETITRTFFIVTKFTTTCQMYDGSSCFRFNAHICIYTHTQIIVILWILYVIKRFECNILCKENLDFNF
jgi:hypothetical protein